MGLTWFAAFKDGFMGWKANLVECPPPPVFGPVGGGGLSEGHIGLSNMRTSPGGGVPPLLGTWGKMPTLLGRVKLFKWFVKHCHECLIQSKIKKGEQKQLI